MAFEQSTSALEDLIQSSNLTTSQGQLPQNSTQALENLLATRPQQVTVSAPITSNDKPRPVAIGSADPPQSDPSKTLNTLGFIADVSGLESIFEIVADAPVIGGPLKQAFEKAVGRKVAKPTTGDFVTAGVVLFGGVGLRGALRLIRGAVKVAAEPLLNASDDVVRKIIEVGSRQEIGKFLKVPTRAEPPSLTLEEIQRAIGVGIEAAAKGEVIQDPVVKATVGRVFKKLSASFAAGEIEVDAIPRLMADFGIKNTSEGRVFFAKLLQEGISETGRTLGRVAQFKAAIAGMLTKEERLAAGLEKIDIADSIFRRTSGTVINVWRAAITAQLSTAMRNLEVGLVRMPLQFFDDIGAGATRALTGQTGRRTAFRPAVENLTATVRGLKIFPKAVKAGFLANEDVLLGSKIPKLLRDINPIEFRRLYNTPLFDVVKIAGSGKLAKANNKVLNFLHVANRSQEWLVRSIAFDARLSGNLSRMGLTIDDVFTRGFASFDSPTRRAIQSALKESVDHALDVTFALAPKNNPFFNLYKKVPELALLHPFPRFLANSLRFLRDHSPFGLMKFATESQRRALFSATKSGVESARQATEAIGKVGSGYVMFAAALAFRNSELAGDKWFEIKVGGKIIDTRPFNPLAAYLLVAEAARRRDNPDLPGPDLRGKDFAEAFVGIRRFRGTGLFIINAFDQDARSFEKGALDFARDFTAGLTVPFRQIRDFMATFNEDEAIVRRGEESGILGPAKANLPFLNRSLPAAPRATRAEPFGVEPDIGPLATGTAKQLTGILARTRSNVERELLQLQVNPNVRTGNDRINRLVTEEMGPQVERRLGRIVESPSYQKLDPIKRREKLAKELTKIKSKAKSVVIRRERNNIIDELVNKLDGKTKLEIRKELQRLRRAGGITKSIETAILNKLRAR